MGKYDRRCATVMNGQLGLITRSQALELGLSAGLVDYNLARELWKRLHPGVYCDPAAPTTWAQSLMAAVLWAGAGAVASHRAAAVVWRLDGFAPDVVEIATSRQLKRSRVVVRRTSLWDRERAIHNGIPVTTIERTLVDLATILGAKRLEEVLDSTLSRRLTSAGTLRAYLDGLATQGRAGSATLRILVAQRAGPSLPAESRSETRFHQLMARNGMSFVRRQHIVTDEGRFVARLDAAVPERKVGFEILSWRWHSSKEARRRDARRLNRLEKLGWTILQFWYQDVMDDPGYVVAEVRTALARHEAAAPCESTANE